MPFVSKRSQAAREHHAKVKAQKLALQSAQVLSPNQPTGQTGQSSHQEYLVEMLDQDGYSIPLEMTIKEEPSEAEANPFVDGIHTEEIKVELLESAEAGTDPIAEQQLFVADLVGEKVTTLPGVSPRCRFCLKLHRSDKRNTGFITKADAEFVLGVQTWGSSHQEGLICCNQCRNMFRMFSDFKKSCLSALARFDAKLIGAEGIIWERAPKKPSKSVYRDGIIGESNEFTPNSKSHSEVSYVGESQLDISNQSDTFIEESAPQQHSQATNSTSASSITPSLIPESSNDLAVPNPSNEEMVKDGTPNASEIQSGQQQFSSDIQSSSNEFDVSTSEPNSENDEQTDEQPSQNNKRKQCFRCWKYFETEFIYRHHKPFCIKARSKPNFLTCTMCPDQFKTQRQLELHMNRHNGVRTIPCRREGCTKKFFTSKTRSEHENICGQTNQLICPICAAILKTTGSLRAHMISHGEPSFVCTQCDKAFHTSVKLKKHSAVHSEARNFECGVCGKRFKSHEANRVHQRIHTQEKPYVCHICGTAFTYNCSLKAHLEKGH